MAMAPAWDLARVSRCGGRIASRKYKHGSRGEGAPMALDPRDEREAEGAGCSKAFVPVDWKDAMRWGSPRVFEWLGSLTPELQVQLVATLPPSELARAGSSAVAVWVGQDPHDDGGRSTRPQLVGWGQVEGEGRTVAPGARFPPYNRHAGALLGDVDAGARPLRTVPRTVTCLRNLSRPEVYHPSGVFVVGRHEDTWGVVRPVNPDECGGPLHGWLAASGASRKFVSCTLILTTVPRRPEGAGGSLDLRVGCHPAAGRLRVPVDVASFQGPLEHG